MVRSAKTGRAKSANGNQSISYRIFDDILALVGTLARSQKDFGADKLHALAGATRGYTASMAELPNLRTHISLAAESLESLAEYVMHTDIKDIVGDARTFTLRHPFAALGVTVAAGTAASYFMRPRQPIEKTTSKRSRKLAVASKSRKKAAGPRGNRSRKSVTKSRIVTNGTAPAHT